MKKLALAALLGGLGIALAGCGGTAKRSLAVAVNRKTAAAGSLTGDRFRVLDVVPFEEEDESPFVGLLQVEAA